MVGMETAGPCPKTAGEAIGGGKRDCSTSSFVTDIREVFFFRGAVFFVCGGVARGRSTNPESLSVPHHERAAPPPRKSESKSCAPPPVTKSDIGTLS